MTYTSVTFNAQVNNKTDTYSITTLLSSTADNKENGEPIIAATNQAQGIRPLSGYYKSHLE